MYVHPVRGLVAALALATLAPSFAHAATGRWDTALGPGTGSGATAATPWIAPPAAGSVYAEWNFFNDDNPATFTIEDRTPDIASFGLGSGTAQVTENNGVAFVTGGGNIYSFSGVQAFTVTLPGSGSPLPHDVWLRISTLGTPAASVATLNGVEAAAVESFAATISGGFGGDEKEWYWRWTAPSAPSYTFEFQSASSSLSLDQLAVYAAPVPEPETYALFALGLAGLALARRRRG